jgi:1-acyl-sn-glycerol-3-phosphate acyltransferase
MTSERSPGSGTKASAALVLDTVRGLVIELRPHAPVDAIGLDALLDRDIGLDSLGVVELAARLEAVFGVAVPEPLVASAQTPRDLLAALLRSGATPARPAAAPAAPLAMEPVGSPEQARSLVEVLDWYAERHADRVHLRILGEGDRIEQVSYGALRQEAAAVAAGLRARGIGPGAAVAIMLPTSRAYFTTFFGALLAGGVPVPVYPPTRPAQLEEHLNRHVRILDNAQAMALVTVPEARRLARLIAPQVATLRVVASPDDLLLASAGTSLAAPKPHDVALLQYTSGSTGEPKGVVLTHANLLANIAGMGTVGQVTSTDVFVSWLPLYHDMGLIGAWLTSLRFGIPLVVMSPLRFLARPARWLQAIATHGGTISGGPNFGFELCLRRITDADLDGVDLRSWRIAFNGAEPVSPDTVLRFANRFAPFGLRAGAITPVYGLAECAVALTVPPLGRGVRLDRVAREPLLRNGRAEPAHDERRPVRHVACGRPLPHHHVRIVDDHGRRLPDRQEGHIQFRGPSATSGYHRNPEATRALFDDGWLRTGDLGYLADGDLFITGRTKDLVIRAGRNLHPGELEDAVGGLPGVRKGCVAVFASTDPASGTERLVIVAETREDDQDARAAIHRAITATSMDLVGTPPDEVVLAPPGTVPKTSSGKIRRTATRQRHEAGRLEAGRVAAWRQVVRLGLRSGLTGARRGWRAVMDTLYGLYAWAVFVLLAVPTGMLVLVTPGLGRRWRILRAVARLLLRLCGIHCTVEGAQRLPARKPYAVAANHASFVDPLFIAVAVPGPIVFAAVRSLTRNPILGLLLWRMGAKPVGGDKRAATIGPFEQALRAGAVVAFFPEGRRAPAPGLEPFRMGAFLVAANTAVPLVPITLLGTRRLLPTHRHLPRRGDVQVVITEPIPPEGSGWQEAVRLQHAARRAILQHLDEPDLL